MARPKLSIDPKQVARLAKINATKEEIAFVLHCSVDTLDRRFADVIDAARAEGKISLRRKQFEVAMAGNTSMLIWLGKTQLGQTDRQDPYGEPGDGFFFAKE